MTPDPIKKKISLLFIGLFILSGCVATEPKQSVDSSGKPAYAVGCSGSGGTSDACAAKAGMRFSF